MNASQLCPQRTTGRDTLCRAFVENQNCTTGRGLPADDVCDDGWSNARSKNHGNETFPSHLPAPGNASSHIIAPPPRETAAPPPPPPSTVSPEDGRRWLSNLDACRPEEALNRLGMPTAADHIAALCRLCGSDQSAAAALLRFLSRPHFRRYDRARGLSLEYGAEGFKSLTEPHKLALVAVVTEVVRSKSVITELLLQRGLFKPTVDSIALLVAVYQLLFLIRLWKTPGPRLVDDLGADVIAVLVADETQSQLRQAQQVDDSWQLVVRDLTASLREHDLSRNGPRGAVIRRAASLPRWWNSHLTSLFHILHEDKLGPLLAIINAGWTPTAPPGSTVRRYGNVSMKNVPASASPAGEPTVLISMISLQFSPLPRTGRVLVFFNENDSRVRWVGVVARSPDSFEWVAVRMIWQAESPWVPFTESWTAIESDMIWDAYAPVARALEQLKVAELPFLDVLSGHAPAPPRQNRPNMDAEATLLALLVASRRDSLSSESQKRAFDHIVSSSVAIVVADRTLVSQENTYEFIVAVVSYLLAEKGLTTVCRRQAPILIISQRNDSLDLLLSQIIDAVPALEIAGQLIRLGDRSTGRGRQFSLENTAAQCGIHGDDSRHPASVRTLRSASLIFSTASGVSEYREALGASGVDTVIAVDAAEIFEAHLLNALTPDTQHLVMIGHPFSKPWFNNPDLQRLPGGVSMMVRLLSARAGHASLQQSRSSSVTARRPFHARVKCSLKPSCGHPCYAPRGSECLCLCSMCGDLTEDQRQMVMSKLDENPDATFIRLRCGCLLDTNTLDAHVAQLVLSGRTSLTTWPCPNCEATSAFDGMTRYENSTFIMQMASAFSLYQRSASGRSF